MQSWVQKRSARGCCLAISSARGFFSQIREQAASWLVQVERARISGFIWMQSCVQKRTARGCFALSFGSARGFFKQIREQAASWLELADMSKFDPDRNLGYDRKFSRFIAIWTGSRHSIKSREQLADGSRLDSASRSASTWPDSKLNLNIAPLLTP